MVILQVLFKVPDRFSELTGIVITRILVEDGEGAIRIAWERDTRGRDSQLYINITNGQHSCPQETGAKMLFHARHTHNCEMGVKSPE